GYDKVLATAAPKNPQLILQGNELLNGCDYSSDIDDNGNCEEKCHKASEESAAAAAAAEASYNDIFRRKWEYYFAYCEGAFATRTLGCSQLVFTRTYNEADMATASLCHF
ncbi:hypothetical protein LPJ64_003866, partial [Coemansia asiatica]